MSYEQAMGFFIISVMLIGSALVTFAAVNAVAKYREKKTKEHKELEEARKMFEQRIALKPKHIGARISQVGNVNFENPQEFEVLDD